MGDALHRALFDHRPCYLNLRVAAVTPLMGLLGTVLGMISVFTEITIYGTGNAGALAGGISEALITTAAGLAVAIPSLVMHRHYTSRIESIVVDLEREARAPPSHSSDRCRLPGLYEVPAGRGFAEGMTLMLSIDMMLDGRCKGST